MNGKRVTVFLLTLLVLSLTLLSASAVMAQSTTRATLVATLSGDKEVPGPGDPDGAGSATIKVNVHKQTVCYELDVWDIEPAVAAHIHVGKSTVAGPVVVMLDAPADGSSDGCATGVDKALIRNIIRHPFQYYVNVHTADYPAGAVRGQLRVVSN